MVWVKRTREGVEDWWVTREANSRGRRIDYKGTIESRIDENGYRLYMPLVAVSQFGKVSLHRLVETLDPQTAQVLIDAKIKGMIAGQFHH